MTTTSVGFPKVPITNLQEIFVPQIFACFHVTSTWTTCPVEKYPIQHLQPWNPHGIQEAVSINSASGSGDLAKQRAAPKGDVVFKQGNHITPVPKASRNHTMESWHMSSYTWWGNSNIHWVLMDFSFWLKSWSNNFLKGVNTSVMGRYI